MNHGTESHSEMILDPFKMLALSRSAQSPPSGHATMSDHDGQGFCRSVCLSDPGPDPLPDPDPSISLDA